MVDEDEDAEIRDGIEEFVEEEGIADLRSEFELEVIILKLLLIDCSCFNLKFLLIGAKKYDNELTKS